MPGVFYYKGAKVQLLDLPGIIEGAKDGKYVSARAQPARSSFLTSAPIQG